MTEKDERPGVRRSAVKTPVRSVRYRFQFAAPHFDD